MRCRRCQQTAVMEIRRHRAAFCRECFLKHCRDQVERTIRKYHMLREGDRPLVAVSGGKDSLAVWDLLLELGYEADGVYLGLGIGDYSDASLDHARGYARGNDVALHEVDLRRDLGFTVPETTNGSRPPCAACGMSKRHVLNTVARERGYNVLVTGHNLDDEAAVLLGNVLTWQVEYLARQRPVLPETDGFVRRVKPLIRLGERETAGYCVVRSIDYLTDECPMAAGNRHLLYKEVLNRIEERSPGTKTNFYNGFLDRVLPLLSREIEEKRADLGQCERCGSPTPGRVCAFCRMLDQLGTSPLPLPAPARPPGADLPG